MAIDLTNRDNAAHDALRDHIGHKIVCVGYAYDKGADAFQNVAIECEDCGCVLVDFDNENA